MWKRWLWRSLAALLVLAGTGGGVLWWAYECLEIESMAVALTGPLPSVAPPAEPRGRILAVVSRGAMQPHNGRNAGYELTELSRAWAVFVANGFDVDIASPQGGEAPMKLGEELVDLDHAFRADPVATARHKATPKLAEVERAIVAQAVRRPRADLGFTIEIAATSMTTIRPAVLRILLANLIGNVHAHAEPGPVRIDLIGDRCRIRNRAMQALDGSARQAGAGLGMGLSIVRRLAAQYRLDLRIDTPGEAVEARFALHPQ